MKQVFNLGGKIVVYEVPAPAGGDNEVVVQNAFSVISAGTEISVLAQSGRGTSGLVSQVRKRPELVSRVIEMAKKEGLGKALGTIREQLEAKPLPLGYSTSGVVIEVGKNIADIAVGDRVACAGADYANHAESIAVPRNLVCQIPEGVDFDEAAFTTIGAIALQGVRRAQVQLGERVVVVGLGLLGQIVGQLSKASGALVIGIDPLKERVELATQLGADFALVSGKDIVSEVLKRTSGVGADAVIICAATPSSQPVRQAMQMARNKGRVVVVGAVGLELERSPFYEKELDFLMSRSYGPGRYDPLYEEKGIDYPIEYVRWTENRNMLAFLSLLAEKRVNVKKLIDRVFPVEAAPEAYRAFSEAERRPVAILLGYEAMAKPALPRRIELRPLAKTTGKASVAVIGAGSFAQTVLLPNIKRIPHYDLRAIVTKTGSHAKSAADKFGAQYCSTDYRDVLNDKDVDMVVIATRHNLHAPLIVEAAKAGKHILIEKPIALSAEECRAVYEAVNNSKVSLTLDFNRRFAPLAQRAKKTLEKRKGPAVITYRVNSPGMKKEHWINDPVEGGGAIVGEGGHFFDLLSWLIGAEPGRIYAEMLSSGDPALVGANNVVCTLSYSDGSAASLIYSTIGSETFPKERIEVFVDGGVVVIDDFRELVVSGAPGRSERLSRIEKGHFELLQEYGRFLTGEGKGADLPKVEDGIRATICSLEVLDALRTGKAQQFAYPWHSF